MASVNEAPQDFMDNPNDESAQQRMIELGGDPDWLPAAGFMEQSQSRDEEGDGCACYPILAIMLLILVACMSLLFIFPQLIPGQ